MEKIKISVEDTRSPQVNQALEEKKRRNTINLPPEGPNTIPPITNPGGGFRNAMVYMAVFGLIAGIVGWAISEGLRFQSDHHPFTEFQKVVAAYLQEHNASDTEIGAFIVSCKEKPEYRNNPYFNTNLSESEFTKLLENGADEVKGWNMLWYICIATFIAIGLSVAESIVDHNWLAVVKNSILGLILGVIGGFLVSLFVDSIYRAMGGGQIGTSIPMQVFARSVGWGILGLFVSIAPGILMRNLKKMGLGLLGGLVGGLLGGLLFDLICVVTGSDTPARFVGIISFGVCAGVATAFLENIAKQGWLKVQAGLLAGKQFIIYKNPTLIGSAPSSDIFLFKDARVDRNHASISLRGNHYVLSALSTFPTIVNGSPVREKSLQNGDSIQIGSTMLRFETTKIDQ